MARSASRTLRNIVWVAVSAVVIAFLSSAQAGNPKPDKTKATPPASASASAPAPGPTPLGQSLTGQAKADYDAARLLYTDGDFAGALVKFSSAYEQSHDPRLLWNMGACEKNLRHYANVLSLVRRYQTEGGSLLTEQDLQEARALASTVEAFTAQLKISVNEPGAAVFVDDEPVGTTPLAASVIVDIGTRKVRVEKPGFVPYQQAVPVGGSREVGLDVQLVKQVHEGKLTVKTEPGASISVDGKASGVGTWTGTLPSGGHTLVVKAPGALPYQSEVVIQDGDTRVVEVALTKLPPPHAAAGPQQPQVPPTQFEPALRAGYGLVFGKPGTTGFVPIGLDIGLRRSSVTHFSAFLDYAPYDRSQSCGVDRHGSQPDNPGDLQVRYGYTQCWHLAAGFQFLFHIVPGYRVHPWLGFGLGGQYSVRKYDSYDPLTLQPGSGKDGGPSVTLGGQVGVDVRVWKGLNLSPFFRADAIVGKDLMPNESSDIGVWARMSFGLRAAFLF